MSKLQKIIQFLILISTLISCSEKKYIYNKFKIISFNLTKIDSNEIYIKFNVIYYSDSTHVNCFSSSIEKGIDGTDDKIILSNFNNNNSRHLNDLINNINLKKQGYRGEKIERGYKIKVNKFFDEKKIVLILKNKISTDTLTPLTSDSYRVD